MAGVTSGPTPWWQLPGGGAAMSNLQKSAPAGYEYDPVTMQYQRTPASAGSRVNQFENAAFPALSGLLGGGSASGTSSISGAFGAPAAGGGGVGVGTGTGTSGPVAPGGGVAPLQMPDMTQSNAATFAAAKDKVGQLSRASLDALNGELGSTGQLGGGASVQATRDVVNNNAEQLGEVDRDLATQNANTALDVAKTNFQGALTQRGQDIQSQEANASLALQANQQRYQLLDLALKGLLGGASSAPSSLLY